MVSEIEEGTLAFLSIILSVCLADRQPPVAERIVLYGPS
jgi:hypothetical protein